MQSPRPSLHFGKQKPHILTVETSVNKDQAEELIRWVRQQEEILQSMYGEEVELCPSPLFLEEMEEYFVESDWASSGYKPGRNRSTPARPSTKRHRPRRKRSTPAEALPEVCTAAPAEPSTSTASASPEFLLDAYASVSAFHPKI
ncbi:hypothetical protein AMECASPLE_029577 [Ameca splendens]|uniref:Uncharacterized protein n=1 Tax=Ameca splendens TaxID=208324 RepID=A0ABV0YHW0_9TELE